MLKLLKRHHLCCSYVKNCSTKGSNSESASLVQNKAPKEKELEKKSVPADKISIENVNIRTSWHDNEGEYYTFLRSFYSEESNVNLLKYLHTPFSVSGIKSWLKDYTMDRDIYLQSYVPERNRILGNELAAAHFIVFRGGAVKFHNKIDWVKADENKKYDLPNKLNSTMYIEAIDCTDMDLYYEGLVNLRNLKDVKWLSLNGCKHMDDWCLDRISNIFSHSLVYLDLRNCMNISERGIGALYKMNKLKILYLDDLLKDTKYEMTCLMLQDLKPDLDIRSDQLKFTTNEK